MDISSVNSDLIRGNSTTIILGSLWNRDRYGYEIIQEIEEKTEGTYKVKQATLYNQLKKLEKAGLISSYEGDPDDTGGGRRRYYSLTEEGRQLLTKEKSEYVFSRTILDKLISEEEFDFSTPAPFDTDTLRPYTKTGEEAKPKVVYKEKIVEKEIPVEVVKEVEIVKEVPVEVEVIKEIEVVKEVPVEVVKEVEKEVLRRVFIDSDGNEITEQEALLLAEEARQREEEKARIQHKPVSSLSEMFERLDSQSEYTEKQESYVVAPTPVSSVREEPQEHTYFTAYASENESRTRSQATLKEIFDRLEEKESQIDESNRQASQIVEEQHIEGVAAHSDFAESEVYYSRPQYEEERTYATSTVIGKRDEAFEYSTTDVNYRDFFSSIVSAPEEKNPEPEEKVFTPDKDLKSRLYAEGYKIRPYNRGNTSEYYTFNFVCSNRLNRDSWLIVMALFLVEIAVMWISLLNRIHFGYFLGFMIGGAALMLIPTVIYLCNPTKRIRANFNFKLSIINRSMIFIELLVVCILIGFFAVGASIDDIDMLLQTIILPGVMLTNIPISSLVYFLLYRSRKYHTA